MKNLQRVCKDHIKSAENAIYYCEYRGKAVLLHRISKNACIMYRDPMCYIADVEDMTNSSYRTARRIMAKAKAYYGENGLKVDYKWTINGRKV